MPEYAGIKNGVCFKCGGIKTRSAAEGKKEIKRVTPKQKYFTVYDLDYLTEIEPFKGFSYYNALQAYDPAAGVMVKIEIHDDKRIYLDYGNEHHFLVIDNGVLVA